MSNETLQKIGGAYVALNSHENAVRRLRAQLETALAKRDELRAQLMLLTGAPHAPRIAQ